MCGCALSSCLREYGREMHCECAVCVRVWRSTRAVGLQPSALDAVVLGGAGLNTCVWSTTTNHVCLRLRMPLAMSSATALATEAELQILFGCQPGTVARNHATGNNRNPGASKHALQTVIWTDALVARAFSSKPAIPRLGGVGLTTPESLALVENFVPSGGRGHASRLE